MNKAPNILFIMADELAPQVLPLYGHPVVKAPHLDALGRDGVVFDTAYTNSPLCAPARASLLTGLLIPRIGTWDNGSELRSELPTIAHYLRAQGYRTALSGKMHFIGADQLHGYEQRLTTDIYPADFSWISNWNRPAKAPNNVAGLSMRPVLEAGPCVRNMQIDYDEEVHGAARQWLFDHARLGPQAKPFFLTVSYTQPHPPFVAQQEHWDRYADSQIDMPRVPTLPPERLDPQALALYYNHRRHVMPITDKDVIAARRAYYGMVSWIDDCVGDLMALLRATGMDRDTLVVFTSDHGEMLGERGMWLKMCMYEWSVRVPLIMSWPGRLAPRRVGANVSLVDLLPTFMDYGVPLQRKAVEPVDRLDGRSLRTLIENGNDPAWSDTVISDYASGPVPSPLRMVKRGHWKYVHIATCAPMLFDLESDPDELNDRAADPGCADILASLQAVAFENYDPATVDAAVRLSQQRRTVIRGVNSSAPVDWNFHAKPGDDKRFVRGFGVGKGEHATKALSRFPYVEAADEHLDGEML
jgi:choline-sulfatase